MAIGDKPNQNLFGTNYNPEDEEEKKARLAAQGAMMGANIPAAAFGQAPAVAPFSMEAAGQVNPMMQQQSLAVTPQALAELPVEANANVNAKAISMADANNPAFEGMSAPEIISAVNAPDYQTPVESKPPLVSLSPFSKGVLDNLSKGTAQPQFGIMGIDPTQSPYKDTIAATDTQPPSAASTFGATPSVAPPVETPSEGAQEQVMDVNQSDIANAQGLEATQGGATAPPPAQTLSQFMRYEDAPEQRTEQFVDEQGRMRFRPTQEALQLQGQGAVAQPPAAALSSFEQDSLSRQQRIGGTGSFEGDSEAREARLRENERQPGESQADRDTRVAQSRTTGGQTEGLSFDDARRRAEGQLAARGVKNPTPSQVNALARGIQAGEPERLAELETKRAKDAAELRDAEAKKDFKPQIVEIGDQKLIQLSPSYYQPVRPEPTAEEPFEPRVLEEGGFTYYETAPNRFERQPSTKVGGAAGEVSSAIADAIAAGGGVATPAPTVDTPEVATGDEFTPQQELGIQKVMADNEITRGKAIEELRKAGKLK